MKYMVLSDIHGGTQELVKALDFYKRFACDVLILLGDLLNHGPRNRLPDSYEPQKVAALLNEYRHNIIAVRGNCDSEVDSMLFDFPINAPYQQLFLKTKIGIQKIFLTHGHIYKIKEIDEISHIGLVKNDIVLSGHTHISGIFRLDNGIVNINPGSLTLAKGGTVKGFAILDDVSICLYGLDGCVIDKYFYAT